MGSRHTGVIRRYDPDTAKAHLLEAAQASARANALHLWAPNACGVTAAGDIRVGDLRYDASGNDNDNLNDEWVELDNSDGLGSEGRVCVTPILLSQRFQPGGRTSVRLHTGCGINTVTALYWCQTDSAVWNNSGDTVFVMDPSGNIVNTKQYSRSRTRAISVVAGAAPDLGVVSTMLAALWT